jgi:hypothetical protein
MASSPNSTNGTNIALWGPTGSGKTWLIHALAKELSWYSDKDLEFSYSLIDDSGIALWPTPPNSVDQGATQFPEDRLWTFERKGKKDTPTHKISSHSHSIIVHDDRGQNLVDAALGGVQSLAITTLQNSPNLILLLDPSTVKGIGVSSPTQVSTEYERHEYTQIIYNLINLLLAQEGQRRIAVCLSKADLLNLILPEQELIKACFGPDLLRLFNNQRLQVKFFRVSSVGFLKKSTGKKVPNITNEGNIGNPDQWEPFNVVSPFFWLFESIERQRLKQGDVFGDREKKYIPYPKPRVK